MRQLLLLAREHNLPLKGANLLIVIVTEIWFVRSTIWEPALIIDWESLAALLTTIVALVALEAVNVRDGKKIEADRALFTLFVNDLPSTSETISFLTSANMGDAFMRSHLSALDDFKAKWSTPECSFHDKAIEEKKRHLLNLIGSFLRTMNTHSFVLEVSPELQKVEVEIMNRDRRNWKIITDNLNSLAGNIVQTHRELIETARKSLSM
jgi:hypothetical protein